MVTLSQLSQSGLPVLPGFVISAAMLNEAVAQLRQGRSSGANLIDSSWQFDLSQPRQLQRIAETLQQQILTPVFSGDWESEITAAIALLPNDILRLSPRVWIVEAGQQQVQPRLLAERYCWRTPNTILKSIKQLWVDLLRANNLLLWQQAQIPLSQVRMAILVQSGVSPIASGRVLPRHPGWEIEAIPGLMHALEMGEVIPDRYWLGRGPDQLRQTSLGYKTYAYRLNQESMPGHGEGDCMQGIPLEAAEGERMTLLPSQWEQLLSLKKQLDFHLKPQQGWEWVLAASCGHEIPAGFYLQEILESVSPSSPAIAPFPDPVPARTDLRLLGQGIAAAQGQAIAPALVVTDPLNLMVNPPKGRILVASTVQPDWLPLLKQSAGIVCETGGLTCHGAIIARELGLPAVVGVSGATTQIQSGQLLLLDGEQGQIFAWTGNQPPVAIPTPRLLTQLIEESQPDPSPLRTKLLLNLSQTHSLAYAESLPVDGVGLLRSESIFLEVVEYHHPYLWLSQGRQQEMTEQLALQIQQFAATFHPRPLFYRALDLRSPEGRGLVGGVSQEVVESNPNLGRRGVFRYQQCPELLDLQLAALRRVHLAGYEQVHLILPFVRSLEEFEYCRQAAQRAALTNNADFQLWIMAEVPSVLFQLADYVQAGVQGISIGSNDLTQLLLGVDREQSDLALQFDERHPAVKAAIAQLIKSAQSLNIPCTLCGEAPVCYPEWVDWLVELGITGISVAPESALSIRRAMVEAEHHHYVADLRPR